MKSRCYFVKSTGYENYGGRGITVSKVWLKDFINFYNWALLNGWRNDLQIDRKNNDGNYTPKNCRFVTRQENVNNRRCTLIFTYKGESKLLKDWSRILKIGYESLRKRIMVQRWTVEKAFTTPCKTIKHTALITFKGKKKTFTDWCKTYNLSVGTVSNRISLLGWSFKKSITTPVGTTYRGLPKLGNKKDYYWNNRVKVFYNKPLL